MLLIQEWLMICSITYEIFCLYMVGIPIGEGSGSVVECLSRDYGLRVQDSPASLHCILEQETFIFAKSWFNPGRPIPT